MFREFLTTFFLSFIFFGCKTDDRKIEQVTLIKDAPLQKIGVLDKPFIGDDYEDLVYVDASSDSINQDGSRESPFRKISDAIADTEGPKKAILVASGYYEEGTIVLKEGIDLLGGFESDSWTRAIQKNMTVISGGNKNRVLIGADNCRIEGFVISNGRIEGTGGAIFCDATSPTIVNNIFKDNMTLKPTDWNPKYWHETANNGGGIHGVNGASPTISNNIFFNNSTQNGRGGAIAFDRECKVKIFNNVFVNNVSGIDDPMRSSDGGAISIFDWCDAEIIDNIFLENEARAKNDGGSVFVALWSSARIRNNLFIGSKSGDDAGALFVGGQEHRYDAPLDPIPPKERFFVTVDNNEFYGNENPTMNSGAMRFTMESRGEFTNNRLAFNNGIYFQRSEVRVSNNIILDNFLFIETKEGLEQGVIEDNVIWGDFELTVPVRLSGNLLREEYINSSEDVNKRVPQFENNGDTWQVISATTKKDGVITYLRVSNVELKKGEMIGRVLRSGEKWGVVRSNTKNDLEVWGNLFGAQTVQLLPTYSLQKK